MANTAHLDQLRRSPAAGLTDEMSAAEVPGVVAVREIAFAPQLGVRARPGSTSAERVEESLGIVLPTWCGQTTGDAHGLHCLWLSPDEFLVIDVSRRQEPGEADAAAAALEGLPGQVIDLSGNRTIIELSGSEARAVLEKGCHVDLHPRAFQVGQAVQTLLGTIPVIIHRAGHDAFRILPRSSFAEYTVLWLIDGMREFRASGFATRGLGGA